MFYISSIGSSATNWLSKSLSKHRDIVCFWPSRSFPPIWPGYTYPNRDTWVKDITPEQYIESLVLCEKAVHGEKIFGSVHGYHGIKAKKACEDFNGHFLYIIRNPLVRIHSCFIHGCEKNFYLGNNKIDNEKIHDRSCKILSDINLNLILEKKEIKIKNNKRLTHKRKKLNNLVKKIIGIDNFNTLKKIKNNLKLKKNIFIKHNSEINEKNFLSNYFIDVCEEFLSHDQILFSNCSPSQALKMEEMTSSKHYYKNTVSKLIDPNIKFDDNYCNKVFDSERHWIHRKNPITASEIWNSWPNNMKEIFLFYFNKYNIKNICEHFDYKIKF